MEQQLDLAPVLELCMDQLMDFEFHPWLIQKLVGAVLELANTEAMAASKLRLEAWKDRVQENPNKLGKCVK